MKAYLRNLKDAVICQLRVAFWRAAQRSIREKSSSHTGPLSRLLIVPSDVWQIIGSRGDDAMVSTIIAEARKRNPACEIGIICGEPSIAPIVEKLGCIPEPVWTGVRSNKILQVLRRYDSLAVVGADVMDGNYLTADSIRSWIFADLAARLGLRSIVVGFSFKASAPESVKNALQWLSPDLHLMLRDIKSLERVRPLTPARTTLVADCAFLLPPVKTAPQYQQVSEWVSRERQDGRLIVALNVHPMVFHAMVFEAFSLEQIEKLNQSIAGAIERVNHSHKVSYLLVPHDFRGVTIRDDTSLAPLMEKLKGIMGDHVIYADAECRAAELKGIVQLADVLLTGRMHLGIAALSVGVPIWVINYQDKFIGLFAHFGLDDRRLLPQQAQDIEQMTPFLESVILNCESAQKTVREALPAMLAKSALNFAPLDSE